MVRYNRICLYSVLVTLFCLNGCSSGWRQALSKHSESLLLMGTVVRVDVCYDNSQKDQLDPTFDELWTQQRNLSTFMSALDSRSDIFGVNHMSKRKYAVSRATYEVIQQARDISEMTNGAFDITVRPLLELWKKSAAMNILPSHNDIEEVKSKVGMDKISLLSHNYIALKEEGVRLDLGGIAKGYIIDETAKLLRQEGFHHFLIDAGGDIYAGGYNCRGKPWRIGIRDPRRKERILKVVYAKDASITTSGDYERFYEIQGEKWSHIVNPITGYPPKEVISATVIAPHATIADGLSTALCILNIPQGLKLIDDQGPSFAALVITDDGKGKLKEYPSLSFASFLQPHQP